MFRNLFKIIRFSWEAFDLRWIPTTRHSIPDEWRLFVSHAFLRSSEHRSFNKQATHRFNAMLDYTSAQLEALVSIEATDGGCDQSIAIMHDRNSSDRLVCPIEAVQSDYWSRRL